MKKYCLLLLLVCCAFINAHGQFSYEGGVNVSGLALKVNGTKIPTKNLIGASFGIVGGIPLTDEKHVFLELGAFYETTGAKITTKPEWEFPMTSLRFPINIEYKSGDKCSKRYFFGAGPYIRDNLSATGYRYDRSGKIMADQVNLIGTDIKAIDLGIGINAGYLGRKHWYIRANYNKGLKNNLVAGDEKNRLKQSTGGLTLGFLFRGCKRFGWIRLGRSKDTTHWRGIKKNHYSRHQRLYRMNGPGAY